MESIKRQYSRADGTGLSEEKYWRDRKMPTHLRIKRDLERGHVPLREAKEASSSG